MSRRAVNGRPLESQKLGGRDSAGFTLLEVVLALSIFALLGTILYGAFALSHNAVAKSQTAAGRSQAQRSSAAWR